MAGAYKGTLEALLATVIDGEQGALNVNVVAQGAEPTPMGAYKGTPEALLATVVDGEMGAINVNVLSGGGGGDLLKKKVHITSAQLLDIYNTPVELVPAPGLNKIVTPWEIIFRTRFGTQPYGSFPVAYLGSETPMPNETQNHAWDQSHDVICQNQQALVSLPLANVVDQPLTLSSDNTTQSGGILTSSLNQGGQFYAVGDTGIVSAGDSTGAYVVATVTPYTGAITAVNQGTKTFTVAGDHLANFPNSSGGAQFTVSGSTGNNGTYTIGGTAFVGGNTTITANEVIPSAVADGSIHSDTGPVATYTITAPGHGYIPGTGVGTAPGNPQPGEPGASGFTIDILTTELGDGSLDVTTYYTVEDVS